jgi:hypothetical protein
MYKVMELANSCLPTRRSRRFCAFNLVAVPYLLQQLNDICSPRLLGFSENGYQLLAPSSESTVAVWDLTFDLGAGFGVSGVADDPSAKLLGISGTEGLRVFAHKT